MKITVTHPGPGNRPIRTTDGRLRWALPGRALTIDVSDAVLAGLRGAPGVEIDDGEVISTTTEMLAEPAPEPEPTPAGKRPRRRKRP